MTRTFRLDKALALHEARTRANNRKEGIPAHEGVLNQQKLGKILYPESNYNSIAFNMSRMMKADPRTVKVEMVKLICETLGVDENFLFNTPSEFDKEYEKYFDDGE